MMATLSFIRLAKPPQGVLENVQGFSLRDSPAELSGLELLTRDTVLE